MMNNQLTSNRGQKEAIMYHRKSHYRVLQMSQKLFPTIMFICFKKSVNEILKSNLIV